MEDEVSKLGIERQRCMQKTDAETVTIRDKARDKQRHRQRVETVVRHTDRGRDRETKRHTERTEHTLRTPLSKTKPQNVPSAKHHKKIKPENPTTEPDNRIPPTRNTTQNNQASTQVKNNARGIATADDEQTGVIRTTSRIMTHLSLIQLEEAGVDACAVRRSSCWVDITPSSPPFSLPLWCMGHRMRFTIYLFVPCAELFAMVSICSDNGILSC